MIIINNKLIIMIIGKLEKNSFLLFLLSSEINLDKARGIPACDKLIKREKVGSISIYIPIPLIPISLVVTIFIIIPSIFVIAPPVIKMIVDRINLFFIINFMKIIKKYFIIKKYMLLSY